jgi:uncharacterized short protein YbdD (DUF466 family)
MILFRLEVTDYSNHVKHQFRAKRPGVPPKKRLRFEALAVRASFLNSDAYSCSLMSPIMLKTPEQRIFVLALIEIN